MIRFAMRARFWTVVGLAIAGAQAGHVLAYDLRFGAAAQRLQASGVHAYFPTLARTAAGVVALGLIGALLVIGAARVVAQGSRPSRPAGGPSFVSLLATLFTVQLAWFMAQEVIEALAAGVAPAGAADLLLWGMVGQLPVAVAGATVLVWLGRRVESAVAEMGGVIAAQTPLFYTTPLALQPLVVDSALAVAHASRARIVKRGPPTSSAFRPF
jgi:hypothetical protein